MPYKCKKHNNIIQYIRPRAVINENEGCPICARERNSGENHHWWKGEINNYTQEELDLISNKIVELHYQRGLGVPILGKLHELYHSQIGKLIIDNGEFNDFIQRYTNFEFDDLLEEKYKYCNIIKNIA